MQGCTDTSCEFFLNTSPTKARSSASNASGAPWCAMRMGGGPGQWLQTRGRLRLSCRTWGICTRRAGKLYRARSRLYRSQILQVNMRWKALAEIYTMHSFAPFSTVVSSLFCLNNLHQFANFLLKSLILCQNFARF